MEEKREPVRRISISLPESLCQRFEKLVDRRGFRSRSQAIASMISSSLVEHGEEGTHEVAATLTLCYENSGDGLRKELAQLQRQYRAEIASSLRSLLADDFVVEVMLLQGEAKDLASIADAYLTLKGVRSGKLAFV